MGVPITIADRSSSGKDKFQLNQRGPRVTIKSYSHDDLTNTYYDSISTDKKGTLNLSPARYQVLKNIAGHDGNGSDISQADMAYATTLVGKKFGVKDNPFTVKSVLSAGNGRTIISLSADKAPNQVSILEVDFENPMEENSRKALGVDLNDIPEQSKVNKLKKEAYLKGYNSQYEISLSKDRKTFIIKIKERNGLKNFLTPRQSIADLCKDFGIDEKELIRKNHHLLNNYNFNDDQESVRSTSVDAGTTFTIPVDMISFENGPTGYLGRLTTTITPRSDGRVYDNLEEFIEAYLGDTTGKVR